MQGYFGRQPSLRAPRGNLALAVPVCSPSPNPAVPLLRAAKHQQPHLPRSVLSYRNTVTHAS